MTVSGHPLVILVRPGMNVRPVHFQVVVEAHGTGKIRVSARI
jgi:hypothetical protein